MCAACVCVHMSCSSYELRPTNNKHETRDRPAPASKDKEKEHTSQEREEKKGIERKSKR
jgi:hypothetical protein